jgi:hypothetical protein
VREIGGYIELDKYTLPMLHDNAIKLNCGRNALAYLIETKHIKKIAMPKFMCDSCDKVLDKYGVTARHYSIELDFKPKDIELQQDEWLYLVNYYGQISNDYIIDMKSKNEKLIVDNAQAYFQMPVDGVDTLYTCRKYFGVADGAILYTDTQISCELPYDESFGRMRFLLGRFERSASEFYSEYAENNHFFANEPIKRMSKLTENLLHGVDYDLVANRRTENFNYLQNVMGKSNRLKLDIPYGAFMYPLYVENGSLIRKQLQNEKIYIPTLWPNVLDICESDTLEYRLSEDILPIPVDQRYGINDMKYIVEVIKNVSSKGT